MTALSQHLGVTDTLSDLLHPLLLTIRILNRILVILIVFRIHLHSKRRQHAPTSLERLDFSFSHLEYILTQMFNSFHYRDRGLRDTGFDFSVCGDHFSGDEGEFVRALEEQGKGFAELEAGFEDCAAAEDVEAEAGTGEGDG